MTEILLSTFPNLAGNKFLHYPGRGGLGEYEELGSFLKAETLSNSPGESGLARQLSRLFDASRGVPEMAVQLHR